MKVGKMKQANEGESNDFLSSHLKPPSLPPLGTFDFRMSNRGAVDRQYTCLLLAICCLNQKKKRSRRNGRNRRDFRKAQSSLQR